ncbi:hypothetical protein FGG08_003302 [Glutinoglossum americanum]|uniref:UBA domain-containing protein n=1 Tax=Glutinoglossum americanum TaxID=1670608 RepID=A0A9P8IBA1_9PEZI|nr:hypothetical protein FGG08_003302 [Glutinoglossum americanum]
MFSVVRSSRDCAGSPGLERVPQRKMNDLSGLDWSGTTKNGTKSPSSSSGYSYPALRPTPPPPLSGRSTPLSAQASGGGLSKPSSTKPGNDSFANLVPFGSSKSVSKLTLQEQQKLLQQEKQRKEEERRQQLDVQFGANDSRFWDTLGGKGTPSRALDPPIPAPTISNVGGQTLSNSINKPFAALGLASNEPSTQDANEDDLLAAFSASALVDSSSHFPPPSNVDARGTTYAPTREAKTREPQYDSVTLPDDDDPFGLGPMRVQGAKPKLILSEQNDDDILGLLGRPVSDILPPKQRDPSPDRIHDDPAPAKPPNDPRDAAVAELVDMGFPADKARRALAETDTGLNVQAAVGWLLNEAHREARHKSRAGDTSGDRLERSGNGRASQSIGIGRRPKGGDEEGTDSKPAWMQQSSRSNSSQNKGTNGPPVSGGEKDITQIASEVGNNLFKSANSLWSTGRKKVQKAVAEFQHEGDTSQPKWMREVSAEGRTPPRSRGDMSRGGIEVSPEAPPSQKSQRQEDNITDEALMLEARPPPGRPRLQKELESGFHASGSTSLRGRSPVSTEPARRQELQQAIRQQTQDAGPRGRLTKQAIEEESSNAYISPARRKKAHVQTTPRPVEPEPDLLVGGSGTSRTSVGLTTAPLQSRNPFGGPTIGSASKHARPIPIPQRPKAPPRRVPPASPSALLTSNSHREKGTEAYKRGDFSSAHSAYSAALSPLPDSHPVSIIILCNRALVNLKVGDPRAAVSDADIALDVIGVSRGEGEVISLADEGEKEMREFFGKALMRKAEGLEQMEKWAEAAKAWKDAVEAGVGGSVSIQGRNRCEKAAGGGTRPAAAASARRQPPRKPQPSKHSTLSAHPTATSAEAVTRLRAANAAAEKVDDEKFALADVVDTKMAAWKGGKEANLRALLASLDTVLWAEAGWKKVGMHELVLANKVKVIYMKGIAKVHPDKISMTATTEQRMISAAVFSTLNEAWDKFKKENGL